MRHGDVDRNGDICPEIWLGDDPHLALVTADMTVWRAAHPCKCDGGVCKCDSPKR